MVAVLTLGGAGDGAGQERLEQWLDVPPSMRALVGNPIVRQKTGPELRATIQRTPWGLLSPESGVSSVSSEGSDRGSVRVPAVRLIAPEGTSESRLREALAETVLEHFWETVLASSSLELIPLDRGRFLSIGTAWMTGRQSALDPVERAWWRVRMGYELDSESDRYFVTMIVQFDREVVPYAHLTFGLRHQEGDMAADFAIDPRAPWEDDDPPNVRHWLAPSADLINGIHVSNLYDWLYTQTHYRGMKVTMEFLPVAREQADLIESLASRGDPGNLGRFRTLRNNCATIGWDLIDALLPLDDRIGLPHPIAETPRRVARLARKEFGVAERTVIHSVPRPDGGEPTADWTVHPAPNRTATPGFQALQAIPGIN